MRLIDADKFANDEYLEKRYGTDFYWEFRKRLDMQPTVCDIPPFINKLCVSSGVCREDKMKVLEQIRTEIEQNAYPIVHGVNNHEKGMTLYGILQIIDKYKEQTE